MYQNFIQNIAKCYYNDILTFFILDYWDASLIISCLVVFIVWKISGQTAKRTFYFRTSLWAALGSAVWLLAALKVYRFFEIINNRNILPWTALDSNYLLRLKRKIPINLAWYILGECVSSRLWEFCWQPDHDKSLRFKGRHSFICFYIHTKQKKHFIKLFTFKDFLEFKSHHANFWYLKLN